MNTAKRQQRVEEKKLLLTQISNLNTILLPCLEKQNIKGVNVTVVVQREIGINTLHLCYVERACTA